MSSSDQPDNHTLRGGHGKGGLFEGVPESPPAKRGRGARKQHKPVPLPPKLGPAPETTWPYIKMGGLFTSSDMEWHIRAYGKDRIIVNPDRLRSRLEKESQRPDQDFRGRFASPKAEEEVQEEAETIAVARKTVTARKRKKKPAPQRSQREKVGQRTKARKETPSAGRRKLPVRGANTRHRYS